MSDMSPDAIHHDCPVCDATIDYRAVYDDGECPACNTERSVVLSVADGVVDVDDLEPAFDGASKRVIPASVRRDQEELPDRAEVDA